VEEEGEEEEGAEEEEKKGEEIREWYGVSSASASSMIGPRLGGGDFADEEDEVDEEEELDPNRGGPEVIEFAIV